MEETAVNDPQSLDDLSIGDGFPPEGQDLVQKALGVAQGALRLPGDEMEALAGDLHTLPPGNLLQVLDDHGLGQAPEVVALTPAP